MPTQHFSRRRFLSLATAAATASATLAACATAGSTSPQDGVVVFFRVADKEDYKIRLTKTADIENARKLLAGEEAPSIPNGVVVRGSPDVNTGYNWHIDPSTCPGFPVRRVKAITSRCPSSRIPSEIRRKPVGVRQAAERCVCS